MAPTRFAIIPKYHFFLSSNYWCPPSPPTFFSFLFPFLPSLPHEALSFARYFFFLPTQQKYDYIIFLVLWQPNEITILLFYGIKKEKFTMEVNLCCALYNIIILLLNIFSHSHLYNESWFCCAIFSHPQLHNESMVPFCIVQWNRTSVAQYFLHPHSRLSNLRVYIDSWKLNRLDLWTQFIRVYFV